MGKFLDDMTHLHEDIDRGRGDRAQARQVRSEQLAGRALNVAGMLSDFASTRAAQGAANRASRQQFLAGLAQDINTLNQGVRNMMQEVHQDRTERAVAAAEERRAQVEAIAEDIRGTLGDFKQKMAAFRSDYLEAVNDDAFARVEFVADTARQVADLVDGFNQERSEQARADGQMRLASIRDISDQVAAIQSSVAEDLVGVRQLFGDLAFSGPVGRQPSAKSPTRSATPAPSGAHAKASAGTSPAPTQRPDTEGEAKAAVENSKSSPKAKAERHSKKSV